MSTWDLEDQDSEWMGLPPAVRHGSIGRRRPAGDPVRELLAALRRPQAESAAEPSGRFMVAVTPEPGMTDLVRRAWGLATGTGAGLYVAHISNGGGTPSTDFELGALRDLAVNLRATWYHEEAYDIAGALLRYARWRRINHIVLGPGRRSRWHGTGSPIVRRILQEAVPAGIDVHVMAMAAGPRRYEEDEE
jgi:K+-sensing histidine kinase KdpD